MYYFIFFFAFIDRGPYFLSYLVNPRNSPSFNLSFNPRNSPSFNPRTSYR